MLKIILLIFFFTLLYAQSQNLHCSFAKDMGIKCLDKSQRAKCFLYGKMRSQGWISLGFSPTNRTEDGTFIFATMNTVIKNPLPPFSNVTLRKDLYQEMGMLTLEFSLNFSMALGMNYTIMSLRDGPFTNFTILENTFLVIKRNRNISENCVILQPDLLETHHLAPVIIMMFLGVVFLFLWLFFKDFQPLASRGLAPPLNILSVYGVYSAQLFYFGLDLETRYYYSCYIKGILINALHQTTFLIILINFLRFFVIQFANQRKEEILNSRYNEEAESVESLIYILDILTNPYFSVLVICSYTIILVIISVLCGIPFANQGRCSGYSYMISDIINGVLGLIIFGSLLLVQVFDCIYTLYKTKGKIFDYFFVSDPFYFRLELLHLPFLAIYYVLWEVVSFLFDENNYIIQMAFNSFYLYWIVLFQSLAIIILTIGLAIYKYLKPNQPFTKDGLEKILSTSKTRPWFIEYSKNEWSIENVMAWDEIQKYVKEHRSQKRKAISEYIVKNFLTRGGMFELNVNKSEVDEVLGKVKLKQYDDDLFDVILGTVMLNLSDTYSRFVLRDQRYRDYLKQNKSHIEVKEEKTRMKSVFETKSYKK